MLKKTNYIIEVEHDSGEVEYIQCKGYVDTTAIQNFFQFIDSDGKIHEDATEIYMSNGTAVVVKETIETISEWKNQADRTTFLRYSN